MSLSLSEYKSSCQEKQKIIISKEKASKHIANNVDEDFVRQFRIDGYVITENIKKCDFLVLNDNKKDAYFIELKGNDISGAIEQLSQTVKILENDLIGYDKKLRIVFSGKVKSGTVLEWKIKHKNLKAEREKLEENI